MGDEAGMLATRLMFRFGSIAAIMSAKAEALRACATPGETWPDKLLAIRSLVRSGLDESVRRSPLDTTDERFHEWLRGQFMGLREERLMAMFGDARGMLIRSDWIALGGEHWVLASARSLFHQALACDAKFIVLAHNHPSGVASPSMDDVRSTRRVADLAHALGIELTDHLVVGASEIQSLAAIGALGKPHVHRVARRA
ncbi:JAB domain-containing protein [Qipengyuania sp. 6B39]|uniref:JAB domain-containing protein n=1 Tax=Qipengyuania proteolytica TaxID=2867239 RepID=UPI001C8A1721|nr:JAB domain-containing protein [Qipengyuania proteolytica]